MANTLTDLAADIYKAADIVGRERTGFIPSVTINAGIEQAAQGDTVRAAFTREATVNNSVTPSMTIPEGDDQTIDNKSVALNQIANVQIPWTGEEKKHIANGAGFETVYGDQIAQAMRGISNKIELHLAQTIYKAASRAVGTAGTALFGSNHNVVNEARQVLEDNGMPVDDGNLSLVMNTIAGTNYRNLSNVYKVNEAGTDSPLRQGTLMDISGVMLRTSGQIVTHTKGTGASRLVNGALAVGDTTVAADGGSGTILAGDVVTFAGDTNKYVVNSDFTTSFTVGGPGLREIVADNAAITIGNNYAANVLLHRSAVELAVRPLETPPGGDAASDIMDVMDPRTGMVYQFALYKGFKKSMLDITVLYQGKVWKEDGVATVMG